MFALCKARKTYRHRAFLHVYKIARSCWKLRLRARWDQVVRLFLQSLNYWEAWLIKSKLLILIIFYFSYNWGISPRLLGYGKRIENVISLVSFKYWIWKCCAFLNACDNQKAMLKFFKISLVTFFIKILWHSHLFLKNNFLVSLSFFLLFF